METYDYIIIGSGFGGSVSGLRLAEKGYSVLMLEKGERLGPKDFPKTNWDLRRWMWMPALGFRGLFKMSFLPHVTVLSGVGVGGGSLVYANTLPIPESPFFNAPGFGELADWEEELKPHYKTARRMLGAVENPMLGTADSILKQVAEDRGEPEKVEATTVAVYFGEPGKEVDDPFFDGEGPARRGCIGCGGCMLGCRFGAKNTLDKNYLYLAEKLGMKLEANTEVSWVKPLANKQGYEVEASTRQGVLRSKRRKFRAKNVIFAGGVMGSVDLLLKLRDSSEGLPNISKQLGNSVRTNSEALIGVTTARRDLDLSEGIAISSIYKTDAHSHLEPVRYPKGAGFFRLLAFPHVTGNGPLVRIAATARALLRHPIKYIRAILVPDWAKYTMILLYMRSLEGALRFSHGRPWTKGFFRGMTSELSEGEKPKASIPEATALARDVEQKIDGAAMSILNETLLDIPTTAHILGGCRMGLDANSGVIDKDHQMFNYPGLYVIDGSAISANPGVNPSLTITALAERAMTKIEAKKPS